MVNAINRCVGVSACRSESGSMCPSFQITGDEMHSTRGRARMFSEMFRGESIGDGFDSKEVEEALDLCLSCKACVSECPVNVDMATYKAEFLHNHYKASCARAHYVMGWLPLLGYIAHKIPVVPTLIDKAMSTTGLDKLIAKVGGLDPNRPLIRFAPRLCASGTSSTPVAALDDVARKRTANSCTANNKDKATVPPLADNERTVVLCRTPSTPRWVPRLRRPQLRFSKHSATRSLSSTVRLLRPDLALDGSVGYDAARAQADGEDDETLPGPWPAGHRRGAPHAP